MLRLSTLFLRTLRADPANAELPSHRLMVRAGYIRRVAPGVHSWLPLGREVLGNIERIVREEMVPMGAQEVRFPALIPREVFDVSGRWADVGDTLFRLTDRKGADYLLGPTHEELFTLLVKGEYSSYKASVHELGPSDARLNYMPLHHVQSIVGSAIAALASGSRVVELGRLEPSAVPAWIERYGAMWFSASPSMHLHIERSLNERLPKPLRFARAGSAHIHPEVLRRLERNYGVCQSPATFELAAASGFSVLTNMNFSSIGKFEEVAGNYRRKVPATSP